LYRPVYCLFVVPFAMELADRIPKERYYDPDFYALEAEQVWSRVWQMACRLDELPDPGDWVTYEILDQSVVVVRQADGSIAAFQNACRHRGVQVAQGRGSGAAGFTCPFHGWCYGTDGANTAVTRRTTFSDHNLLPGDLDLVAVRCETWGGCAWINLDRDAPALRPSIEPVATILDAWKVESLHAEWWCAARIPANWKLAQEAFVEQYHVLEAHPQLRIPDRMPPRDGQPFDPQRWLDGELQYLRTMSEGMDGMVHRCDVAIAERLRHEVELPADPALAMATWHRTYNDAVTAWHRDAGHDVPDLNELAASKLDEPMGYVFPHFFVLPMYSSASSYRFRPLGPEETLMEIWSLTRDEPRRLDQPEAWAHDDPRWPPIPAQDFSNLPRQQRGLHAKGFDYMRLSSRIEGHISNFHRVLDGYLAGRSHEALRPALPTVNVNPLEQPALEVTFG
jgi:phenylpropionate dioxygenase-like ring-hydroxylating dioxygenase large terminal subunit